MDVTIREYREEDRERLAELFDDFQDYLVALDPLHRLRRTSGYGEEALAMEIVEVREKRGLFAVALDGEIIVGFVVGILQERKARRDVIDSMGGRITELYVDSVYRGRGIGTLLMHHIEAYFRMNGCDIAQVEVFVPNSPARRLYEKFGYAHRDIDTMKEL